ncbi:AraC family transcriptional regulator [Mycolicibacterium rutilum]|nr:AraC family transcriptional regulator [Mycolicibacterium rutilum]
MVSDPLSSVFDLIEVRGLVSGGFVVRGDWITRFDLHVPLKFAGMVAGRARLWADDMREPITLETGDVVILNGCKRLVAQGGPGTAQPTEFTTNDAEELVHIDGADLVDGDVMLGGHVEVNPAGEALLRSALPKIGHVRASATEAPALHAIMRRLVDEVTADRVGATFAARQYGQLLLLELLRAFLAQTDELPPGWLRLLTDERLRPAVESIHAEPGKPWQLQDLARASAMSRTSFAERFRAVAGVPPLAYVNGWRMQLARHALRRGDTRIGPLAIELGYTSESAFSNAFKREVGMSPLRYRASLQK